MENSGRIYNICVAVLNIKQLCLPRCVFAAVRLLLSPPVSRSKDSSSRLISDDFPTADCPARQTHSVLIRSFSASIPSVFLAEVRTVL